jgi:hypothetical protein
MPTKPYLSWSPNPSWLHIKPAGYFVWHTHVIPAI